MTQQAPIKYQVLVDYRERASGIIERLKLDDQLFVQEELMPVGDIAVGRYLIERKTVADLWASLHDGRLFPQLHRLTKCPPMKPILLVEGREDVLVKRIAPGGSERMLWVASVMFGVPTIRTQDVQHTVRCLKWIALHSDSRTRRPGSYHKNFPDHRLDQQLYVLSALPGIGRSRARALLEKFHSIRDVMLADVELLTKVPGISRGLAERIASLLGQ